MVRVNCMAIGVVALLAIGGVAVATPVATAAPSTNVRSGGGSVSAWGNGADGRLGDRRTTNERTPVAVAGLVGVVAISAGLDHACALQSSGAVECWGSNIDGDVGDGTTARRLVPVRVVGLSRVLAISAAGVAPGYGDFTCALMAGGTVECWGANLFGQLGDGTTAPSYVPVPVSGLSGVRAISAGGAMACALLAGGTAKCWGNNFSGQLGDGANQQLAQPTPVAVSGLKGAVAISIGGAHACAVLSNRTVECWGANVKGAVGDGTTIERDRPVPITGLTGVVAVSVTGDPADLDHSCALRSNGVVSCWGSNSGGQLGDGTTRTRLRPVAVAGLSRVTGVSVGGGHSCALLAGGKVTCWGSNADGEIGDGTANTRTRPVAVSGLTKATAISSGIDSTFALVG
jgi:alpha-tubulin suppressor-like RCC1 family protein